ncbi:hypothetical protein BCV70DRAFT_166554 [Testicularia cyperi]|uniref:Uncharacterized protein n=1 Tax=Testicularia cyperi TaxID=1882483 RepID=A0A317XHL9_9BASI|nr:hypothetical protein BCV70DRAFT_166554 [Testicularia cyperi]
MPYQYLTFSDLYEEEVRTSAPSSPVLGASASLSPVFLLPSTGPSHSHSHSHNHASSSGSHHYYHHRNLHTASALQISTRDSDEVACSSSSSASSLHLDFLKVWKHKASMKKTPRSPESNFSTPTSSRRSSFTSSGFGLLHPGSATSSANTSPAISRQVTKVSDYDALLQRTARAEEEEEKQRQNALESYLQQAAETGLSLRRF